MSEESGKPRGIDETPTICGICPGGCGVYARVEEGRLTGIRPLPGHPVGLVCPRGARAPEIVHSPDRLRTPLLRTGERGEGKFAAIGWDEALDRLADAFQRIKAEHGAEAVMTYFGRGAFESSLIDVFGPRGVYLPATFGTLFPFGSPNTASCSAVCYVSYGLFASTTTIGADMRTTYSDFAESDLIVVWGANPPTDSPPDKFRRILDARKRGARLVVIDPLRSQTAKKADQWIGLRPGTDGALALALLHVVIAEGLYDRDFVENWTVGFEALRAYVAEYPPERAQGITGVPRETIVETARAIGRSRGASLVMYTGLEYTSSGVQNIRAVLSLWAVAGHLDVPGGLRFRPRPPGRFPRAQLDPPPGVKPIGADKYPLFCDFLKSAHFLEAPRAILHSDPYPVRGLLAAGASLLTSLPDPDLWKECFRKLDFFASFNLFPTADTQFADLVFPATTYFENLGYQKHPGYVQLREPVLERQGEARPLLVFLSDLARRLGCGDGFPATEAEHVGFAFEGSPVSLDELRSHPEGVRFDAGRQEVRKHEKGLLRPDGKPGFNTPSGKVELVSSVLEKYGYDGLPKYEEPREGPLGSPEVFERYPLVLSTGARLQSAFRSQHLNIPGLLKLQPKPQVLLHPADAAVRGLADGDPVWVESPRDRVGVWARVTDDVMPGQVELNVGGGNPVQAEAWREANANFLTDLHNRDAISGFPVYKALLCEIRGR